MLSRFGVAMLVIILVSGCGGIRPPGLLSTAQIEALANKVDSPDDPEAIWADNKAEEQWQELKKFIVIFSYRIGYRRGWRDGWDAVTEEMERREQKDK